MRISLAQINTIVGDLKGNTEKILAYVEKARKNEADIITFPELSICGYPPEDLLLKDGFVKASVTALNSTAKNIPDNILAVIGCVSKGKENRVYNSAALVKGGKVLSVYSKADLPNYGVFDEKRYFCTGIGVPVFKLNDSLFGVNICEDIWQDNVPEQQACSGAKFMLNISASPYHTNKLDERISCLGGKAKKLGVYVLYNNLVGGQDELVFDGNSFVIGPDGQVKAQAKSFEEDLIYFDYDDEKDTKASNFVDLGKTLNSIKPPMLKNKARKTKDIEEVYKALVLGTQDYVLKNGFKKVLIGVSGGIDSALVCAIACSAVGKENVVGVTMPSIYSSKETLSDSHVLSKCMGIRIIEIPIVKIFGAYLDELRLEFKNLKSGLAEENLQARIRGNLLMALSNKFGWLVLSTGNKSEMSCGYSTLYGDMAGGFSVIKDVYKTLVYDLSKYVNKTFEHKIPQSIIKRPPTAELRPNQLDSDSLPPYGVLDKILKCYIEQDMGYDEIVRLKKFGNETVKKVIKLVDSSEFKRRQAPPGVKITPKAFGRDRRMPITNRYS